MKIKYKGFEYSVEKAFIKQPGFELAIKQQHGKRYSDSSFRPADVRVLQDGEIALVLRLIPERPAGGG